MIRTYAKLGTIPSIIELWGNEPPKAGQRRKYREVGTRQWRWSTIEAVVRSTPILPR